MSESRSRWDGVALRLTGRSAYRSAWALQREIWERRQRLVLPDTLIVLEHDPVITIGKHGDERFLRLPCVDRGAAGLPAGDGREPDAAAAGTGESGAAPVQASARAPEVVRIDRGGEITYHGPGQITAYLIADLRAHDLGVRSFVRSLEETVIRTLGDFGIEAFRRDRLIGVWSIPGNRPGDARQPGAPGRPAKVAAAGVRIARGVSLHGIALNVDDRCLEGFRWMVPCGLAGEQVTTMAALRASGGGVAADGGEPGAEGSDPAGSAGAAGVAPRGRPARPGGPAAMDPDAVAERLIAHAGEIFGIELRPLALPGPTSDDDLPGLLERLERHAARGARRPRWLRVALPSGAGFAGVRRALSEGSLCTVCEEARCPNRQECWDAGTATFMILGAVCTRGCRFCAVEKGAVRPPDPDEPGRVARAAAHMGLRHVVVTSVTRDDLADGGAAHFAATIRAVRRSTADRRIGAAQGEAQGEAQGALRGAAQGAGAGASPVATIEVLIPDLARSPEALDVVLREHPEVLNHNIETVPRLYPVARPGADYRWSLEILQRAAAAGLSAKSGFMIGLGESAGEIRHLLAELRQVGCERVTIGQYLQPRRECLTVKRYWTPEEFARWGEIARELGFAHVESAPLVRSSYHAGASVG